MITTPNNWCIFKKFFKPPLVETHEYTGKRCICIWYALILLLITSIVGIVFMEKAQQSFTFGTEWSMSICLISNIYHSTRQNTKPHRTDHFNNYQLLYSISNPSDYGNDDYTTTLQFQTQSDKMIVDQHKECADQNNYKYCIANYVLCYLKSENQKSVQVTFINSEQIKQQYSYNVVRISLYIVSILLLSITCCIYCLPYGETHINEYPLFNDQIHEDIDTWNYFYLKCWLHTPLCFCCLCWLGIVIIGFFMLVSINRMADDMTSEMYVSSTPCKIDSLQVVDSYTAKFDDNLSYYLMKVNINDNPIFGNVSTLYITDDYSDIDVGETYDCAYTNNLRPNDTELFAVAFDTNKHYINTGLIRSSYHIETTGVWSMCFGLLSSLPICMCFLLLWFNPYNYFPHNKCAEGDYSLCEPRQNNKYREVKKDIVNNNKIEMGNKTIKSTVKSNGEP